MTICTDREFHTAHLTWLGHLAYGGPLRLYRVIPQRWVTHPCPAWLARQDLVTERATTSDTETEET